MHAVLHFSMVEVRERLRNNEELYSTAHDRLREAEAALDDVRERRTHLFRQAYDHIVPELDRIYKVRRSCHCGMYW